jgi:hypothetical protein
MQAIGSTQANAGLATQVRELIMTILDASAALKRLLPDEELEHGFEFHWGHSNSSEVKPMPWWGGSLLTTERNLSIIMLI